MAKKRKEPEIHEVDGFMLVVPVGGLIRIRLAPVVPGDIITGPGDTFLRVIKVPTGAGMDVGEAIETEVLTESEVSALGLDKG